MTSPRQRELLVSIGRKLAVDQAKARIDRGVVTTPAIRTLLDANAPVAIGVSGGKDSCALALATVAHLDAIGHTGPRILIHSDLGSVEWQDSLPTCERLAARLGLELVVVRREAGGMMERWEKRWENNVARYRSLLCVRSILPWSTPSMRFCTSELKTAVICRELVRRFPGQAIVSACGIRADESPKRKLAPRSKTQPKLTSKPRGTWGVDWHPILEWTLGDVLAYLESHDFALHNAYTHFGMSRVSCCFCIMSKLADLVASATCPDNAAIYRVMVALEIRSTFAFQSTWLGDIAPHLLDAETRAALADAKQRAMRRVAIEARIPKHLLFTKGWPTVMPTWEEAVILCDVRIQIAELLMLGPVDYTEPQALLDRYRDLMAENARREAEKAAKATRRAARLSDSEIEDGLAPFLTTDDSDEDDSTTDSEGT